MNKLDSLKKRLNFTEKQIKENAKFDCNTKLWDMIREGDDTKIEGCQNLSDDFEEDDEYENFINRLYEEETRDFYMNSIFGLFITIIFLWLIIR